MLKSTHICVFNGQLNSTRFLLQMAISGPGRSPARFLHFWPLPGLCPFSTIFLLQIVISWPGRLPRPDFPIFGACLGMCLFSTTFLLQMAFSGPGRLPDQRMRRWRRLKPLSRESHRLYSLPPSRKMEIITNPP